MRNILHGHLSELSSSKFLNTYSARNDVNPENAPSAIAVILFQLSFLTKKQLVFLQVTCNHVCVTECSTIGVRLRKLSG